MRTTRQRILQIIQRRRSETVGRLAKELGLAPATVRRHLDILQRDGLVTFAEVRKPTGRPEHSFSLTDRGHESLPKGYDALLSALVAELGRAAPEELAGKSGAQALNAALTRLGHGVAGQYLQAGTRTGLAAALGALQDRDFEPEVRQNAGGTRIALSNCPFRSVALVDDAICSYDSAIIEATLGTPVRRERCISRGHDCCEYFAPGSPAEAGQHPAGPDSRGGVDAAREGALG